MMRRLASLTGCIAAALALGACGGPMAAPPPPKAAAPAAAGTPTAAIVDPKATIGVAKAAASAVTAAIGERQAAPQPGQPTGAGSVAAPAAAASAAAPALRPTDTKYAANGRRDPFEPLDVRQGSERSTVASAKLTGIVQGNSGPMALVETSDGIGYILKLGDTLAEGRVTEIGNNMVVFAVAPKPGGASNRVVLKLAAD